MAGYPEIPGYKILKVLGEGATAKVYLAIQEKLDRKVVIKILEPTLLKHKMTEKRFIIEAKTASKLHHSNIIQIIDYGKAGDNHYIVMEHLEESLENRLARMPQGKMPPEEAFDIVTAIIKALDFAHDKGVFHRDIKPDNIIFRQDGTPILVDFGIARVFDSPEQFTMSGQSLGTVYYMSPEQCRAHKGVDGRTDIYSLGAVLFEMLTGKKPYDGDIKVSILLQHIEEPVPQLPRELSRYQPLIDHMMAKDKEKRISNGEQFKHLLDQVMNNAETISSPTEIIPTSKKKVPIEEILKRLEKTVKPLISKGLTFTKGKYALFKGFPFNKKIKIATIGVIPIILLVVIIFMFSGKEIPHSKPIPEPGPEAIQSPISDFIGQWLQHFSREYQEDLKRLPGYYESNNLEIVEKGPILIDKLQRIKDIPELKVWEKKFSDHISQLKNERETKISSARGNFERGNYLETREAISRAKKIKYTPEVKALEKGINKEYSKVQDQLYQMKDDQAFMRAESQNTVAAYKAYLNEFPKGRHKKRAGLGIKKADWNIKKLKAAAALGEKKNIHFNDAKIIIETHGFFDDTRNKKGTFKGHLIKEKTVTGEDYLVIDHITGLMWYNGKLPKKMKFKNAEKWIKELNEKNYGGYNDWRLPTLVEAASLLRKTKNKNGLHIPSLFSGKQKIIWTEDHLSTNAMWVVRFDKGTVHVSIETDKHQVIAVRSLQ
jgi:serine/threonine protein kinase